MLIHRKSEERGHAEYDWLSTWHTFSFNTYFDPHWMQWGPLRVINEDIIAPGQGFPTHPHKDMEIITYVISGALTHRDSTGSASVIKPGLIQHMTAGRGITHSEFNTLDDQATHLLQIWINPAQGGLDPGYSELEVGEVQPGDGLRLLVTGDMQPGTLHMQQKAKMSDARLAAGEIVSVPFEPGRIGWIQLISGRLAIGDLTIERGDGIGIRELQQLELKAESASHFVLFDLTDGG